MARPVKVGDVRPMSGGGVTLPPADDDRFTPPGPDRESMPNPFQTFLDNLSDTVLGGAPGTFAPGGPGFVPPQTFSPRRPATATPASQTPLLSSGGALAAGLSSAMDTGNVPFTSAGGSYQMSPLEQALAYAQSMQGGGGGGVAAPDYSAYRAALTDQAQQINAQIQAMYNALGEEAGANVGRIQDIYGGASTGIGDVYGSAIDNVGDAYSSAQQQAADQLARLGIEEAAPAVVNPMALSQAEAISQLEQGQAGGLAATERFGSAASGFGSQMAQVAQQQGTEMNAAVLAALQNRLMDSLLMEEQGRQAASGGGGGGGNILESAMDFLRLQEMANAPGMAQQELELRAAEIAADNRLSQQDKLVALWADIRNDYDNDEEAWQAAQTAMQQAQTFFG